MSKEKKKQELKLIINKYVNNNVLDITTFRLENPKLYTSIPYYFGTVTKMLDELGLIKIQKTAGKNNLTFRNRLAYDRISELRKDHTLEEIANMYGVTRALVNQLFQALDVSIKLNKYETEKGNKKNETN